MLDTPRSDTIENQPKEIASMEPPSFQKMMRMMMEQFRQMKEDNRALWEYGRISREENQRNFELLNKNIESIIDDSRKWREERKVSKDKNMEQMSPEPENNEGGKDDDNSEIGDASNENQMEIEEIPSNKSTEPASTEPKENREKKIQMIQKTKDKEIENHMSKKKEERRTLRPRKARVTTESVSYTHLDVYKRQGLGTAICFLIKYFR